MQLATISLLEQFFWVSNTQIIKNFPILKLNIYTIIVHTQFLDLVAKCPPWINVCPGQMSALSNVHPQERRERVGGEMDRQIYLTNFYMSDCFSICICISNYIYLYLSIIICLFVSLYISISNRQFYLSICLSNGTIEAKLKDDRFLYIYFLF